MMAKMAERSFNRRVSASCAARPLTKSARGMILRGMRFSPVLSARSASSVTRDSLATRGAGRAGNDQPPHPLQRRSFSMYPKAWAVHSQGGIAKMAGKWLHSVAFGPLMLLLCNGCAPAPPGPTRAEIEQLIDSKLKVARAQWTPDQAVPGKGVFRELQVVDEQGKLAIALFINAAGDPELVIYDVATQGPAIVLGLERLPAGIMIDQRAAGTPGRYPSMVLTNGAEQFAVTPFGWER